MRSSLISNRYLLILLAGMLIPAMPAVAESTFITKGSKAATMDSCVAPTDIMRRNHMDFLKHGRDETVRDGVRGLDYSLAECIDCHAASDEAGKPVPVDAEGQFCQACHGYVAVSPACFQCHRTTPEKQGARYGYHMPGSNTAPHETQPAGIQRD
jgi:hypothetical protein